jgi:hypothetical protein
MLDHPVGGSADETGPSVRGPLLLAIVLSATVGLGPTWFCVLRRRHVRRANQAV